MQPAPASRMPLDYPLAASTFLSLPPPIAAAPAKFRPALPVSAKPSKLPSPQAHVRISHATPQSILVCCDECNASFMPNHNPDTIKWHRKLDLAVHRPVQGGLCDVCGSDLHYLGPVTHAKMYHCFRCQCAFARGDRLLAHSAQHTHRKAFACSICHTGFSRKNRLSTHMASIHQVAMEETYFCSSCGQDFAHASRLRNHAKACCCDASRGSSPRAVLHRDGRGRRCAARAARRGRRARERLVVLNHYAGALDPQSCMN